MLLNNVEIRKRKIYQSFIKFFKLLSDEVIEKQGTICTYSPVEFALFNSVISTHTPSELLATMLEEVVQLYQEKKVPFCWWHTDFVEPNTLDKALLEKGFEKGACFDGMCFDLAQLPNKPKKISSIEVNLITNKKELAGFSQVIGACFHFSKEAICHYTSIFGKHFENPNIKHYKIEKEGQIVATGTIFMDNKVCGFYNLAVLPEYRNQSFAEAMKWHRLHIAKALGAEMVVLQASDVGKEIDHKIGFRPYMKFTPYSLSFK